MTEDTPIDGREGSTEPDGGVPATVGELDYGEDHAHGLPPVSSIRRWFVTTNHKDVGILYLVTSLFFLVFGGVLALLMRIQLWAPRTATGGPLSAVAYNQAVSMHGLIMIFWFLSPFAFGLANYLVPLQIGAKDLAFPRLNALSYWLYLFSGVLVGISFFEGQAFAGGWTMYAPFSTAQYQSAIGANLTILALTMFVISTTVSSVNFLTTIHRMRAKGLTLTNLPPFTWSMLLTIWMMLFAFAALLAGLFILVSDRLAGTVYFTSESGALLWDHMWWFFGHPEVYIVFFPALGVMFETFQTFSGRQIIGRKWVFGATLLVALQSFMVWMHHMFLTSINLQVKTIFMVTTIGISLPFDLMMFSLIYTLVKGRIKYTTPFLFSLASVALFIIGGITGVFLGAVALDFNFRGTYWVVAHFHYVMLGGGTALFAGLYYWFPKMTGKMYDERLGQWTAVIYFVGFNLLYFPLFIAWEIPRRVFDYRPVFTTWQQLATVGAFVLAFAFLLVFYNLFKSLYTGEDAEGNPWEYGSTVEWAVPSPPPLESFPGLPEFVDGRLQFSKAVGDGAGATDGGVAAATEHGGATGHDHGDVETHASVWPAAIAFAVFLLLWGLGGTLMRGEFVGGLSGDAHAGLALAGLLVGTYATIQFGRQRFQGPEGGLGEAWPFHDVESNLKTGIWIFMASDVVLFGLVISAYVFSRAFFGWTAWHLIPEETLPGLVDTYILLGSSFSVILALVAAQKERRGGLIASMLVTMGLGLAFLVSHAIEWIPLLEEGVTPSSSIFASTYYLTVSLHALHVTIGLLLAAWIVVRAWQGAYLGEESAKPVEYFGIYWHFVDIVWLFLFPLFYIV
ncbi:MAG: cbb3-type cytochrome c oxidase subunit I [Haloferacaceae archaeon]